MLGRHVSWWRWSDLRRLPGGSDLKRGLEEVSVRKERRRGSGQGGAEAQACVLAARDRDRAHGPTACQPPSWPRQCGRCECAVALASRGQGLAGSALEVPTRGVWERACAGPGGPCLPPWGTGAVTLLGLSQPLASVPCERTRARRHVRRGPETPCQPRAKQSHVYFSLC